MFSRRVAFLFSMLIVGGICCLILQLIALNLIGGGSAFTSITAWLQGPNITHELIQIFKVAPELQQQLLLIDERYLSNEQCFFCTTYPNDPVTFAVIANSNVTAREQTLMPILRVWEIGYWVEQIVDTKHSNRPIGFILQHTTNTATFEIVLFYEKESDYWWHGSIKNDVDSAEKFKNLKISYPLAMANEESFSKSLFHKVPISSKSYILIYTPVDVNNFAENRGRFIGCDLRRADHFHRLYGRDAGPKANRFRHRVRKLLALTKTVMEQVNVPFWISSGTCLGWYRQCDVIPYSMDVDIGVFARDVPRPEQMSALITHFQSRQLKLIHRFGRPEDSMQLSFAFRDIKLDVFFFYEGPNSAANDMVWNYAHRLVYENGQLHHGIKFRYKFPYFTLCWTEFLELRLRVPCETKNYIEANYGPDWFTPVSNWRWDTSPFNVENAGEWPPHQVADVLQTF